MGGGAKGRGKAGKNGNKNKQRDKRVAGFDEIKRRNEELLEEEKRKEEEGSDEDEEGEKSEEEEEQKPKESAAVLKAKGNKVDKNGNVEEEENVSDVLGSMRMKRPEAKEGDEPVITRKMKEEMAKEAARKRYEEKHARGETDEAKADLARLTEVRARRAKEKEAKDAELKAAEDSKKAKKAEEEAKRNKERSKAATRVDNVDLDAFGVNELKAKKDGAYTGDKSEWVSAADLPVAPAAAGTIDHCRDLDDDFM